MRVFISHSSKDAKAAEEVCALIEQKGHSCFLAPRDIRSGYEYAEEIITGIDESEVMLLLLSEQANSSPHVLREIERAVSKKIGIIVYKLEEVALSKSMEYFLMTHQWINSKAGGDYSGIVDSIERLAADRSGAAVPVSETKPAEQPQKKTRKNLIIIIAAALLVAACAAGVGVCAVSQSGQDSSYSSDEGSSDAVSDTNSDTVSDASSDIQSATTAQSTQTTQDTAVTEPQDTSGTTESIPAPEESTVTTTTSSTTTTASTATSATTTLPTESEAPVINVELGDTIVMGTYNGEPIEWRVLSLSENGKQAVVLSDKIITMKAFDACEGGRFNYYEGEYYYNTTSEEMTPEFERLIRGDNRWELSNIRAWLNSDRENVVYKDHPPMATAMCEQTNGYNTEAGFLKSFTDEELSAILTTQVKTNGSVTEDKVFLLSREEYSLLIEADINKYAVPTEGAVENDGSRWYVLNVNDFGISDHYWWLRDAYDGTASKVWLVNYSYKGDELVQESASLEGYGIRPAMTVDLTSEYIVIE